MDTRAGDRHLHPKRTINPPSDVWETAKQIAHAEGQTLTGVIVAALRAYIAGWRPED